jgi:hypothetical protein
MQVLFLLLAVWSVEKASDLHNVKVFIGVSPFRKRPLGPTKRERLRGIYFHAPYQVVLFSCGNILI